MIQLQKSFGRDNPGYAGRRRAVAALCRAAKAEGFAEARARPAISKDAHYLEGHPSADGSWPFFK